MRRPKAQQSPLLHLNLLLEGKLRLYGTQFIVVAEDAKLDTVMSGVAYDIVSARADFVQEIGSVCGDVADWGGNGVRAADADGLVHVAHYGKCMGYSRAWRKVRNILNPSSNRNSGFIFQKAKRDEEVAFL